MQTKRILKYFKVPKIYVFNKVKSFRGGVHPEEDKNLTENLPLEKITNPNQIILPLSQHIGKPANALVS
jgi:electron transport complex protein RnfC